MSNDAKQLDAKGLVKYFKDEFKTKIKKADVKIKPSGAKKRDMAQIWMTIDKSIFKDFIKYLCAYQFPHLAVVSGNDFSVDGQSASFHRHFPKWRRQESPCGDYRTALPFGGPAQRQRSDIPGSLLFRAGRLEA